MSTAQCDGRANVPKNDTGFGEQFRTLYKHFPEFDQHSGTGKPLMRKYFLLVETLLFSFIMNSSLPFVMSLYILGDLIFFIKIIN